MGSNHLPPGLTWADIDRIFATLPDAEVYLWVKEANCTPTRSRITYQAQDVNGWPLAMNGRIVEVVGTDDGFLNVDAGQKFRIR